MRGAKFKKRQTGSKIVTRIHSIPPRIGELFYIRVLLLHRPASSFKDLRTIHDRVYATYQKAATALGLFEDESEAVRAIKEAVAAYSRPGQLRFLFAHLLLDLPTSVVFLWETFREHFSANLTFDYNEDKANRLTLQAILKYFRSQRTSLNQFGLPEPVTIDRKMNIELDAFDGGCCTLIVLRGGKLLYIGQVTW